jgi:SAM-dependent methyltransferase
MTDAMIEAAKGNVAEAGLDDRVEVRKGLIEDLPVESESIDWVISNCVISLSPEKARVYEEIARVLKPGGRMLVSDIVADNLPPFARALAGTVAGCVAGTTSEAEYVEGLRQAGLEDVEVRDRVRYDGKTLIGLAIDHYPALGILPAWVRGGLAGCVDGMGTDVQSVRVFARKPAA